jgi:hypothetical protein
MIFLGYQTHSLAVNDAPLGAERVATRGRSATGDGDGQADAKRRYPSSWNVAHPDRTAGTSARGRPLDRVISDSSGSSQILLRFVTSPREVHTGVIA